MQKYFDWLILNRLRTIIKLVVCSKSEDDTSIFTKVIVDTDEQIFFKTV